MNRPEHPEESSAAADAERLLEAELGHHTYLERERERLPSLLASGERLLAVEATGLRSGRAGILAVTDRRLIHVYWGYFRRRLRITEIDFMNVERVRTDSWRSFARVIVHLKQLQRTAFLPSRTVGFPLGVVRDAGEHADELARCIRLAVSRVQEPIRPAAAPPWTTVG